MHILRVTCWEHRGMGLYWQVALTGPRKNIVHTGPWIWVCLKMVSTPKPNGFADHYPVFKWLFHWEYTLFSDKPICVTICNIYFAPSAAISTSGCQSNFQRLGRRSMGDFCCWPLTARAKSPTFSASLQKLPNQKVPPFLESPHSPLLVHAILGKPIGFRLRVGLEGEVLDGRWMVSQEWENRGESSINGVWYCHCQAILFTFIIIYLLGGYFMLLPIDGNVHRKYRTFIWGFYCILKCFIAWDFVGTSFLDTHLIKFGCFA